MKGLTIDGLVLTSLLGYFSLDIIHALSENLLQLILYLDLFGAKSADHPQTLLLVLEHSLQSLNDVFVSPHSWVHPACQIC